MTLDGGLETSRCSLLFSSRIRAFDYRDEMGCPRDVEVLVLAPTGLLRMARDIEAAGITQFTLDRCPRCGPFVAYAVSCLATVEQVWRLRCVHKATEAARLRLYVKAARDAARGGRIVEARDIALETAAHVTLEDPTLHLLLGNLGVALGDASLAADAVRMLRLLGAARQAARLGAAISSATADFEELTE